ncbi:hypothetical protein LCM20_08660 [Halobacillus litoralis]|uniref:DUF6339 family protein n=1 Tax=Halobacillus litoralis TaxID=45668 RepID=UPI001CD69419|nr:DUF6339 family protein [Halobacillus litoralis]MCA0970656.1 hypothetical protein [Halobacillus litoralis]
MKTFNASFLNKLKSNVEHNKERYKLKKPPIENYDELLDEETMEWFSNIKLETQPSKNEKLDFSNSKRLYSKTIKLTPAEASDEKLWAFMTHITHWNYMRERWPVEETKGKEENFILDRYFFKNRPISRNGLARLWWASYITYNEKFDDPFYLTSLMMKNEDQDVGRIILETPTICRNKKMVEVTLTSLDELKSNHDLRSRDYIRYAARYINLTGSVTLWDFLSDSELRKIIDDMKDNWLKQNSQQIVLNLNE